MSERHGEGKALTLGTQSQGHNRLASFKPKKLGVLHGTDWQLRRQAVGSAFGTKRTPLGQGKQLLFLLPLHCILLQGQVSKANRSFKDSDRSQKSL